MADVQTATVSSTLRFRRRAMVQRPAKRVSKPREVPMIAVGASKEEYAEIKNGLAKLMAALPSMGCYG